MNERVAEMQSRSSATVDTDIAETCVGGSADATLFLIQYIKHVKSLATSLEICGRYFAVNRPYQRGQTAVIICMWLNLSKFCLVDYLTGDVINYSIYQNQRRIHHKNIVKRTWLIHRVALYLYGFVINAFAIAAAAAV